VADLIEVLKEMACFRNRIVVVMKARNENERVRFPSKLSS